MIGHNYHNHRLKEKHIIIQLIECLLIPIDIIKAFISGYNTGKLKAGYGNTTCALRRPFNAICVYPWSLRNYILFRIGVTMSKYDYEERPWINKDTYKQFIYSFNPKVRNHVREQYYAKESTTYNEQRRCPK